MVSFGITEIAILLGIGLSFFAGLAVLFLVVRSAVRAGNRDSQQLK